MSSFDEWLKNKWQLLLGGGRNEYTTLEIAYNAGMERAAEIAGHFAMACNSSDHGVYKCEAGHILADEIRKEIDK